MQSAELAPFWHGNIKGFLSQAAVFKLLLHAELYLVKPPQARPAVPKLSRLRTPGRQRPRPRKTVSCPFTHNPNPKFTSSFYQAACPDFPAPDCSVQFSFSSFPPIQISNNPSQITKHPRPTKGTKAKSSRYHPDSCKSKHFSDLSESAVGACTRPKPCFSPAARVNFPSRSAGRFQPRRPSWRYFGGVLSPSMRLWNNLITTVLKIKAPLQICNPVQFL